MKLKPHSLLLALMALLALSCSHQPKVVFDQSITFDGERWLRQDTKAFDIPISNADDYYNVYVTFRLDTSFVRGNNLPLVMNLYSANGERRNWNSYLNLRTPEGNWLCPLDGKYLVVDQRIKEYFSFNGAGTQRLEIHHGTDRYEIYGTQSMGLRLEVAKIEYPE